MTRMFPFVAEYYPMALVDYILFNSSPIVEHLGSFLFLSFTNKLQWTIMTGYCENESFHFYELKAQESDCWVLW